jgi:hypothetical protein
MPNFTKFDGIVRVIFFCYDRILKRWVSGIVMELGRAASATIEEFGHAIHDEASRKPVQGRAIHPMTRYMLNYCGLTVCRETRHNPPL